MRILVRNVANGCLLASDSEKRWTPSTKEAHAFKRSHDAVETAERMNLDLRNLELIFNRKHGEDMIIRLHENGSSVVRALSA
jgi:hypothetical protein